MHHPPNVKQMRHPLLLSSNSRNPQGTLAGHGMAGQVSFLQPYRSAPQARRIATDPLRSTRPHPRDGSGDGITCHNARDARQSKDSGAS